MKIVGEIEFPGDKSISHRAVCFSFLSKSPVCIENLSNGEDVKNTISVFQQCGLEYHRSENKHFFSRSEFMHPKDNLNCGNSGTTARLLLGIMSGLKLQSKIIGDQSLSNRPMNRVINPLIKMGAKISSKNGYLPINTYPSEIFGINYALPIASAQIKSSLLYSGLFAKGKTVLKGKINSRNHTELMMKDIGINIDVNNKSIILNPIDQQIEMKNCTIAGDISTASFFIVAATLLKGSNLSIKNLLYNSGRIKFVEIMKKMGAKIELINQYKINNEDVVDMNVEYSDNLNSINLTENDIPLIIDEIPIFCLLSCYANGETKISGAKELRFKESDRIKALFNNFHSIGVEIYEYDDGLVIKGPAILKPGKINTYNDHRIAMTFEIAKIVSNLNLNINNNECINISSPEFFDLLKKVIK